MLIFISLLTVLGACESCTEIGQVCYKCRGNIYICNDGSSTVTTAEGCISYVMSNPSKLSAHYKPANSRCFPYTCTNNLYFQDSTRFIIRKTCNTDCSNFTLAAYTDSRVTDAVFATYTTSLGQCFEDCFDTVGCYAFSYGSSVCSIYTSCGTSCSIVYQYGTDVYTRTCHTETDCGPLSNQLNGAVDTSSGTALNDQASYTCSAGYVLEGSSTRTCQNDGEWSGSDPECIAECGALMSPPNGAVDTSSGTTYNNQAIYTCLNGYTLVGTITRTCQSDGLWSGLQPVCNAIDCGTLTSPPNGVVDTSSGTTFNNQAIYTCLNGYTLVGTSTRNCPSDGLWSGLQPVCNAIDCGTLTSPPNGVVDTSSGTTFNNQAIYTCLNGNTLVGTSTRNCQSDGLWSGLQPVCNAIDCGTLTSPPNGVVDTSSGTTFNNQAIYTCLSGNTLVGTSTRNCQSDGLWSGLQPVCNAIDCGTLTSPPNGAVNTSSGTIFNNQAIYTCLNGYPLVGTSTRTCQSDGLWSGSQPDCNVIDCGTLTSPPNGTVDTSSGTTFNNQAIYTCLNGYTLVGTSTRNCQSDGLWSGVQPVCNAIDCGTLTSPPNGVVDTSSGTTFNNQAIYTCLNGNTLVGISKRTCQSDGLWSGLQPVCNAIDCGTLTSPPNGAVDTSSGTTFNNQAIYTCLNGNTLVGISTRTCQSDGFWSGLQPVCNAIDCGTLTSPPNGAVDTSSGTTFNNQAIYTCLNGYTLVGTSTRTCQSDGLWSGLEPVCNATDCGTLMTPLNGAVDTTSGTTYNNQAIYTCSISYILLGSSIRTCLSGGQWSGSQPDCIADCDALTSPPHGLVDTSNGTTYSNQAVYTCSTGYRIVGNSSRICQSNGQWSGSEPSCTIVDCGSLSPPDNGYVQNPANTTYLEQATFTCSAGYNLTGNNQRTCQSDGSWSGTSPTCTPVDCGIPVTPGYGTVAANNGTTYGQNATYSCNIGYTLSGFVVTTCNANGFWDSSPSCHLTNCGFLAALQHGVVQYTSGTTYRETATFTCNTGYYLSHLNNRTCQSNGFWSMNTPICVQNGMPIPEPIKLYLAPCICYPNKTFTGWTQQEIIDFLIKAMRIERNSTALARRKLTSAKDSRFSSKVMGYTGVSVMSGTFGFMLLIDLITIYQKWNERRQLESNGYLRQIN